jgi:hypothetical protein
LLGLLVFVPRDTFAASLEIFGVMQVWFSFVRLALSKLSIVLDLHYV